MSWLGQLTFFPSTREIHSSTAQHRSLGLKFSVRRDFKGAPIQHAPRVPAGAFYEFYDADFDLERDGCVFRFVSVSANEWKNARDPTREKRGLSF